MMQISIPLFWKYSILLVITLLLTALKFCTRPGAKQNTGSRSGSERKTNEYFPNSPYQCCGSGTGSGSARIRNFLQDPEPDPELEVMDPDPALDPELDLNLTKIHPKN
jgi:hypothetical protein